MENETLKHTGVVVCATGEKYVPLVCQLLNALYEIHPEIATTVWVDEAAADAISEDCPLDGADIRVLNSPEYGFGDKIVAMANTPYEKTIYLDADTVPVRPFVHDLMRILDIAPIAALPNMSFNQEWEAEIASPAFGQFNTGVIVFDKQATTKFFEEWLRCWNEEINRGHDQPSFRAALVRTQTMCAPLANEFNFMGTGSVVEPRILHFTGWRRLQAFYDSPRARKALIDKFRQEGFGGNFSDFAPAGSQFELRSGTTSGRLSWWLTGAVRWLWVRFRRYGLGAIRRVAKLFRSLRPTAMG